MPEVVVAQLVRQDHGDLIVCVALEERVGEDDATCAAHPRQIGVRFGGLPAVLCLEDAHHGHPGSPGKIDQALAQRLIAERPIPEEEGIDHDRCDVRERDREQRGRSGAPEPPPLRRPPDDGVEARGGGHGDPQRDRQALGGIRHPRERALPRETKGALHQVAAHKGEGEGDHA